LSRQARDSAATLSAGVVEDTGGFMGGWCGAVTRP
jgi:hypothetical protein